MLLHDILKNYRLILASQSPRRRQLLSDCGLEYELAERYEVEEVFPATMEADEVPVYLSRLKSEGYPTELAENDILLTADTVVIVDNEILGKPADEAEAHAMLRTLSGRSHRVTTGVTLRSKSRTESFAVQSAVYFRALTDEEIDYYVERYRPMDKAGSYGIQDGFPLVKQIDGDYDNVVGLPINTINDILREYYEK